MDEKNKSTNNARYKKNGGITLIALVITIIVMLILAAISINIALNGGLFEYAGKAVGDTQNAIDKEQELAGGKVKVGNKVYNSIDDYLKGKEAETFSEIYTATTEYKENGVTTAWIPKGFAVGTSEGINKVDDGLVIQDEAGNQFVWIPVTVTGTTTAEKEASFDAIRTTRDDTRIKEPTEDSQEEYEEMRASVIAKGGFYMARYEAGYSMTEGRVEGDSTTVVKPISKRLAYPYFLVSWPDAKAASHLMYNNNSKYGVKSSLCYGVQWDAMLLFLEKANEEDSRSWGNYGSSEGFGFEGYYYDMYDFDWNGNTGSWVNNKSARNKDEWYLLQTGASERNKLKNLYDVAGNCGEWTMEGPSEEWPFQGAGAVVGTCLLGEVSLSLPERCLQFQNPAVPYAEDATQCKGFRPTLYIN